MTSRFRNLALATTFAAAALSFAPRPASAGTPFCSNKLTADSFYDTVSSNGKTSQVTNFMQLRNTTNQPVRFTIVFSYSAATQRVSGQPMTLPAHGSQTIKLGVQNLGNPAGNGKLDNTHDVPPLVRVNCM